MAFGQQSGPPASSHQLRELLALLHDAGHVDFRDARGPLGFTQRQAAGKFTGPEAAAFIEALTNALPPPLPGPAATGSTVVTDITAAPRRQPVAPATPDRPASPRTLGRLATEDLAAELRRRGWRVIGPVAGPEVEGPTKRGRRSRPPSSGDEH